MLEYLYVNSCERMSHLKKHPFTGNTDHDFGGLLAGEIIRLNSGGTALESAGFSASTSGNLWSASTGSNSIIANNGTGNIATGPLSLVFGFSNKSEVGAYGFIGGYKNSGVTTYSYQTCATIVNGSNSLVSATNAFIGNGNYNVASNDSSVVINGTHNHASGAISFIGNGSSNVASGYFSLIGNGKNNSATTAYAVVVGGINNLASGSHSFIGSGYINIATGLRSVVINGYGNVASGQYSSVLNGGYNTVIGQNSSILVGSSNTISGGNSSIIAGSGNIISGNNSSIIAGTNITSTLDSVAIAQNYSVVTGGTNPSAGIKVLVGGTAKVDTDRVTAASMIQLTAQDLSGTPGDLYISSLTPGVSFNITSSSGSDTRTIFWQIWEPAR